MMSPLLKKKKKKFFYTASSGQYLLKEKLLQHIIFCYLKGIVEFYFIYYIHYKI